MAIWQDLVDDHGFTARYASVKRFVAALRTQTSPEARVVITTAPGEEAQVDYGDGPMVRDPATGKYRRTRLFVLTLGYSRKSVRLLTWRSSTQIWAELHEDGVSPARRHRPRRRARQPARRRAHARHLRPGAQSALSRCPRALRRRGVAVPRRRSGSEGQGRSRRRPCAEDAAEGAPLRDARGGADVSRPLGDALGRHAHPWHHQAPGRGDVCGRTAALRDAAGRAVSLLPVRRPDGASGRLCGSRGRLLQCAARLDWPPGPGPVGCPAGPAARAADRATSCASMPARRGATIASTTPTGPVARPAPRWPLWRGPRPRAPASASSAITSISTRARPASGASSASSRSAKKHGPAVVEDAAKAALEVGVPTYRFVRRYLERRPPLPLTLRQIDPLIRQLGLYRDLIDRTTGDPT